MNVNPTSRTCLHVPELSESEYAAQLRHCNCMIRLACCVRQRQISAAVRAFISACRERSQNDRL